MADNVSSLSAARIKKMTYMLLPGNGAAGPGGRHDLAYQLWKESWEKTYSELKTAATLKADDFARQDIISVLFSGDEAVSLMLHTRYDLELAAVRDHSYFSSYPPEVLAQLRAGDYKSVLSFEYLTLSSKWRKSLVGAPVSKVISGLSAKVVETLGIDAIAVTRVDRKVNEIFSGFGARILAPNLTLHNVAVHLMKLDHREIHPGPDKDVNQLVDHLWRSRSDFVGLDGMAASAVKKAA